MPADNYRLKPTLGGEIATSVTLTPEHGIPEAPQPRDPLAQRLSTLAVENFAGGHFANAEDLFRQTLERTDADERSIRIDLMSCMALAQFHQERITAAEKTLRSALDELQQLSTRATDERLPVLTQNLSSALASQRRFEEAERAQRDTVTHRMRQDGGDAPETLRARFLLVHLIFLQQKYQEAEPLLRETLAEQTRLHGPEHMNVVRNTAWLGQTLYGLQRYQEALPLLRAAAERWPSTDEFPLEHGGVLVMLGSALDTLGRSVESLPHLRQAIELQRSTLGPGRTLVETTIILALALVHAKRPDEEFAATLKQALAMKQQQGGPPDDQTGRILELLGMWYYDHHDMKNARIYLNKALEICTQTTCQPEVVPDSRKLLTIIGAQ